MTFTGYEGAQDCACSNESDAYENTERGRIKSFTTT